MVRRVTRHARPPRGKFAVNQPPKLRSHTFGFIAKNTSVTVTVTGTSYGVTAPFRARRVRDDLRAVKLS